MNTKVLGGGSIDGQLGRNPDWSNIQANLNKQLWSVDDEGFLQAWIVEEAQADGGQLLENGYYANPVNVRGESDGVNPVGKFSQTGGVTFNHPNDAAQDGEGNWWVWTGSLPYTAAQGTAPTEGDYTQVFYNVVDAKNVTFDDGKTLEQFREDLPEEEVDDGYALKNIAATYVIDSNKLSIYPSSGNVVTNSYYLFERNGVAEVWRANNTIRTSDPKAGNFTLLPRSDRGGVLLTSQLSSLNLDVSSGSVFKFTLTSQITQLQFDNIPTEQGKTVEVTLILKQGIGSQKVTWPSSIKWQNGREPVLSYKLDAEDIIVFTFVNGVTTPYAYFVSGWQL